MIFHSIATVTSNPFQTVKDNIAGYLVDDQFWMNVLYILLKINVIYIACKIVVRLARNDIQYMLINDDQQRRMKVDSRRAKTIGKLLTNVITYTINFIIILLVLSQLNFDILPLLAGAGVVGLAIGFGAQNLVKDVITGFFIIFEDQFAVGDVIQTGSFKGTVEEIGIRVTKIKSWTGELFIIPNGSITEVTNFSIHNSVSVVDISIAYEADVDKAINVIKETASLLKVNDDNIIQDPEVLGVQTLGASDVIIRIVTECKPNTQAGIGRKMNAMLKKALDENRIEIPYPRLVTYHRNEKVEG